MRDPAAGSALRIGVALSAGSASAMAELGALEALIEAGIPIHCVAGTSAGAIVGAALAAGRLSELRETLAALSRRRVMRLFDPTWPRQGLIHGRRALDFIAPHLGDRIESLDLPFAAVATDLRNGDEVWFRRGPVFEAVRASIAVPGIFTPWRVEGRLLVDGGLVNPVPVSAAESLGADFVIAINVLPLHTRSAPATPAHEELRAIEGRGAEDLPADEPGLEERLGLFDVVSQASRIFSSEVASYRLQENPADALIQIDVPEVGMFEVYRTTELVEIGRACAEEALPSIRSALAKARPLRLRIRDWPRRASELLGISGGSSG